MSDISIYGLETATISPLTLIFLVDGDLVLTLRRASNKSVYPNKISGFGGKVEPGEQLLDSAKREFKEETGLELVNPILRGTFIRVLSKQYINLLYIFIATEYKGKIQSNETEEGTIAWLGISEFAQHQDTVDHIKKYISRITDGSGDFYSGVGYYKDGVLENYADNKKHFASRK